MMGVLVFFFLGGGGGEVSGNTSMEKDRRSHIYNGIDANPLI